jgi:hypothetical protein
MSNGDDTADDSAEGSSDTTPEDFESRLDDAAAELEAAETESDLDAVEETLDDVESDLEAADLPEAEDEDEEDPQAELEARLGSLRDDLEDARGPYGEDVIDELDAAESTIADTRWTDDGEAEIVTAVETFLDVLDEELDRTVRADEETADALVDAVDEVKSAVERASLDADDDAEVIEALLTAAETLNEDLDAAEEWSDLTVQEQFAAEGFYDVLDAENRKDYPPEWNAVKIYAKQNEPEPILTALERLESDFMEENILEVLKRMAPEEAFDAVHQRAQRRNTVAVEILGKIGDERALETLHGYIDGSGDTKLQQVSLRALGEIGSEESVQPVANRLDAEDPDVRSAAARSLGLLGDTRAIEPLGDVLESDDVDTVRASAAWALNQIGTERALEQLTDYTDDTAYIVQAEAQKAT